MAAMGGRDELEFEEWVSLTDHVGSVSTGLSEAQLRGLVAVRPLAPGESCPICLDEMDQLARVLRPKCGHEFHKACLVPWLRESSLCPVCKGAVSFV